MHFFNKVKMKLKKIKVRSGKIQTHNLRIWSYVDLPHDYSEKYNFLELSTDICTKTFISVIARNIPIAHNPSRKNIYSVL